MYAVLPKGAKPSKSVSKDQTSPVLTHAELREHDGGWELVMTDSYQLARVKLSVKGEHDGEELTAGAISTDALKAIEKTGAFYANGTVEPCNPYGVKSGLSFARTDLGKFPSWDQLEPDIAPGAFAIGLDAELLYQLAQSLGAKSSSGARVRITFVTDANGQPNPLRPMRVEAIGGSALESRGLLMPIRLDR